MIRFLSRATRMPSWACALAAAAAMAAAFAAPAARAASFEEKRVLMASVELMPTCRFSSSNTWQLPFGRIDPTASQRLTTTKTLDFNCSAGMDFQVKVGDSASGRFSTNGNWTGKMVNAANENVAIPWRLEWTAPSRGSGWGSANIQRISLTGVLDADSYKDAPAGLYGDNVDIVIVY